MIASHFSMFSLFSSPHRQRVAKSWSLMNFTKARDASAPQQTEKNPVLPNRAHPSVTLYTCPMNPHSAWYSTWSEYATHLWTMYTAFYQRYRHILPILSECKDTVLSDQLRSLPRSSSLLHLFLPHRYSFSCWFCMIVVMPWCSKKEMVGLRKWISSIEDAAEWWWVRDQQSSARGRKMRNYFSASSGT